MKDQGIKALRNNYTEGHVRVLTTVLDCSVLCLFSVDFGLSLLDYLKAAWDLPVYRIYWCIETLRLPATAQGLWSQYTTLHNYYL